MTIGETCKSDPMLHFPYDDHFNDVSCNRALSTTYGDLHGATLHKQGNHKFVCFAGKTNFEVFDTVHYLFKLYCKLKF